MTKFFASFPKHLDHLVRAELEDWEFENLHLTHSGAHFDASAEEAMEFGLTSPFISRLYLQMTYGEISSEKDLYSELKRNVQWDQYLSLDQNFKIQNSVVGIDQIQKLSKGGFKNTNYLNMVVKDSLCDFFNQKFNRRPNVETKTPDQLFYLFVAPDKDKIKYTLYVDTLGLLSNRGYRVQSFSAPLRENLAAAIVAETNWNPDKEDFGDMMCGSGTLISEAIIYGFKVSPQYLKLHEGTIFPIEKNQALNCDLKEIKDRLRDQQVSAFKEMEGMKFKLWINDLNRKSLKTTRENLKAMKLPKRIESFDQDATKFRNTHNIEGVIVCNPPYGKRIDTSEPEMSFYKNLGEVWKNQFKNSRVYLFTPNAAGRKRISLRTSKRVPFLNGDIECRLYEYLIN